MTREAKTKLAAELRAEGWSYRAISQMFNVHPVTVKKWLDPEYAERCRVRLRAWSKAKRDAERERLVNLWMWGE